MRLADRQQALSGTCDHVPSFWRGCWGLKLRYSAHAANTLTCWFISSALSRQTLTYAIHTLTVDATFQSLTYTDPTRAACAPSSSSCGSCLTVPPWFAHPLLENKADPTPRLRCLGLQWTQECWRLFEKEGLNVWITWLLYFLCLQVLCVTFQSCIICIWVSRVQAPHSQLLSLKADNDRVMTGGKGCALVVWLHIYFPIRTSSTF